MAHGAQTPCYGMDLLTTSNDQKRSTHPWKTARSKTATEEQWMDRNSDKDKTHANNGNLEFVGKTMQWTWKYDTKENELKDEKEWGKMRGEAREEEGGGKQEKPEAPEEDRQTKDMSNNKWPLVTRPKLNHTSSSTRHYKWLCSCEPERTKLTFSSSIFWAWASCLTMASSGAANELAALPLSLFELAGSSSHPRCGALLFDGHQSCLLLWKIGQSVFLRPAEMSWAHGAHIKPIIPSKRE